MAKKNILFGIVAAIVAGLVGCLIWGILFSFNIIAGIASFLIVLFAGMAYKKFGKVQFLSAIDYVVLIIISLVELVATFIICYILFVQDLYVDMGITVTFAEALAELVDLIGESAEIRNAIITDCVISVAFLLAGIGYYIRQERKNKKREQIKQTGGFEINPNATVIPYSEAEVNGGQAEGQVYVEPTQEQSFAQPVNNDNMVQDQQNFDPFTSNVNTEFVVPDSRQNNEQPDGVSVRPFNPDTDGDLLNGAPTNNDVNSDGSDF